VSRQRRSLRHPSFQAALYGAGWAIGSQLPESAVRGLCQAAADVAWWRGGPRVVQLSANLRRVVGPTMSDAELSRMTRSGMRSYLRYWGEAFRLPTWSRSEVLDRVVTIGESHLRDPLAAGRGVVAALPHSGNWDLAGAWACLTGAPVTTVVERLRPEVLYQRFVEYRMSLGMEVLPLSGDAHLLAELSQRLRAGRLVPLLADRDLRGTGLEVSFFGETIRMPAGPALLASRTGAALIPTTISYSSSGIVMTFHPEVAQSSVKVAGRSLERLTAMTQECANVFAAGIAAAPQDWHMMQPLWESDRPEANDG
jgi:phosphatidylinositol dimannoside acyltransferase